MNKTQLAIKLFRDGDYQKSLSLFKTFKLGISREQNRTLNIAHEMLASKRQEQFYTSIGFDLQTIVNDAMYIIQQYCDRTA